MLHYAVEDELELLGADVATARGISARHNSSRNARARIAWSILSARWRAMATASSIASDSVKSVLILATIRPYSASGATGKGNITIVFLQIRGGTLIGSALKESLNDCLWIGQV